MSEPFATYLMPIYAALSWIGLLILGKSGKYMLPVALIGWVWALGNIIRNQEFDLGIVTFFLVILSCLAELKLGFTRRIKVAIIISSILVALNYSIVVIFWESIKQDILNDGSKSDLWMNIFFGYCIAMMIFWIFAAIKTFVRECSTKSDEYDDVESAD